MKESTKNLLTRPLKQEKPISDGLIRDLERFTNYIEGKGEEGEKRPGFISAASRVGLAMLLSKEIEFKGVKVNVAGVDLELKPMKFNSLGEEVQNRLIDKTNKLQAKMGVEGDILLPTIENIQSMFTDVYEAMDAELPEEVPPYSQLNEMKAQEAKSNMQRVESGDLDDIEIRDEELSIVRHLIKGIGKKSAHDLKETLDDYIYGREMDIVSADIINRLARKANEFTEGKKRLGNFVPKKWMMVDYRTSRILMTGKERREVQDTLWTVTPNELIVKYISTNDDVTKISLDRFSKNSSERVRIRDGTFTTVDVLRKRGTRLLQRVTNMVSDEKLGGVLLLRDDRRDEPLAKIPVNQHKFTTKILETLGDVRNGYERTQKMTERAIDDIDVSPGDSFRPNLIKKDLPTELIFVIDAYLNENGSVDWNRFKKDFDERIDSKRAKRLGVSVRASYKLDKKGKAPAEDMELIGAIGDEIEYLKKEKKRLNKYLNK